jgi:hypothetical protein
MTMAKPFGPANQATKTNTISSSAFQTLTRDVVFNVHTSVHRDYFLRAMKLTESQRYLFTRQVAAKQYVSRNNVGVFQVDGAKP